MCADFHGIKDIFCLRFLLFIFLFDLLNSIKRKKLEIIYKLDPKYQVSIFPEQIEENCTMCCCCCTYLYQQLVLTIPATEK